MLYIQCVIQNDKGCVTNVELERAEPSRLWSDTVGLAKRHGIWRRRSRALGQHQPRATQNWGIVLLRLLGHFPCLPFLVVLLEHLDCARLLTQEVDHEWHSEVVKAMAPRELQDHVRPDEIVASIQHTNIALPAANVHELRAQSENTL